MKKKAEYARQLHVKTLASMWRENPKKKQLREELPFIAEILDACVEASKEYRRGNTTPSDRDNNQSGCKSA